MPDQTDKPHSINLREYRTKFSPGTFFITKSLEPKKPLLIPDIAKVIAETWVFYANAGRIKLAAFVVMPDHWHVLFSTGIENTLPEFMKMADQWISRNSKIQLVKNQAKWQDGYYDTQIKSIRQMCYVKDYIENNPVRAELCESKNQWRWSSTYSDYCDSITWPWPWDFEADRK